MCIVLLTTAHPEYALIAIDNRDEFVLRPTSRPHWWDLTPPSALSTRTATAASAGGKSTNGVLSSRDLYRPEQGTWLGITKAGLFAVLTNFREPASEPAVAGVRSRGGMVKAWLGGLPDEGGGSVIGGVRKLVEEGEGVRKVGGFSMVCGRLKRRNCAGKDGQQGEGIAIVSNRSAKTDDVPVVAKERNGVWGLSNAVYSEDEGPGGEWPKVKLGKRLLRDAVGEALAKDEGEDALIRRMFEILDTDTLPKAGDDVPTVERIPTFRQSIFIPPLGRMEEHHAVVEEMKARLEDCAASNGEVERKKTEIVGKNGFDKGLYGTQRQTVVLVDWKGKVTFVERALWDEWGRPVRKGEGDVRVDFEIEGWDEDGEDGAP